MLNIGSAKVRLYGSLQSGGYDGVLFLRNLMVMASWGGMAWFFLLHARRGWVGIGVLALATVALRPFSPERPSTIPCRRRRPSV